MKILEKYISSELNIKNSRFLSELFPCQNQAEARNLIKEQKNKYFDATHVVHAFILGFSGEIMGMSDDGEPSGTAGRPALDVLKGRNCTNLVLTITRWFGGTLLGTGGLVKAYGDSAKTVIEKAIETQVISDYIQKKSFAFKTDYSSYQIIKRSMSQFSTYEIKETFGNNVEVFGYIKEDELNLFSKKIKDITNGQIELTIS